MNKEYKTLQYEEEDGVGILVFNRPDKLNALNGEVFEELHSFCDEAAGRKLKGLILTGAGEKAFIAGADIQAMSSMSPEEAEGFAGRGQEATLKLENLPFPVVAAVNGFALGGGLEIALACDFILCSDNALFGLPEVGLGLIPGFGGTQRLAKIIGRNRAKEMIFTGRKLKFEEALIMGLVLSSHQDKEKLLEACKKTVEMAAMNSMNAIGTVKSVINKGVDLPTAEGLEIEKKHFGAIFGSYDMKEGTRAFLEKRRAEFKGE